MEISKDLIKGIFVFVRTWDVSKYTPEESVDEYELRTKNGIIRFMIHKSYPWEGRWDISAISFTEKSQKYESSNVDFEELKTIIELFKLNN